LHYRRSEDETMGRRAGKWRRVVTIMIGACLGAAGLSRAQFTSLSDRSNSILEGNWQSCREADGQYSERVYDGKWPGVAPFELHMGPFHDFALFRGVQDEHRDHASPQNLLQPHTLELREGRARQSWDVGGLHLDVALAGGSREECESWYVTLKRSTNPSSSH
jgi:hypothetical protein